MNEPKFTIKCDASNNPPDSVAMGVLNIEIEEPKLQLPRGTMSAPNFNAGTAYHGNLNAETFAHVLHSLAAGSFDVTANMSTYHFDKVGRIQVCDVEIGAFLSDVEQILAERNELAGALSVQAKKIGDLEDANAQQRERCVEQEGVIAGHERDIATLQRGFNASEAELRRERDNHRVDNFTSSANVNAQAAEIERLIREREAAVTELNALAVTADALHGALSAMEAERDAALANFKLADRALSCRNETIASLEKLLAAKEEERRADVRTLTDCNPCIA